MLKRNIYQSLLEWKTEKGRRPLLLRGARQTGKTYIVNEFGQSEFSHFIALNFERNPEYKDIFNIKDPFEILERISLFTGKKIYHSRTLIFLDEIQECPNAIMALRYFYEEIPELYIIGAGSLLEFALKQEGFRMPVGRVQYLYMYPLTFGEFMYALNEDFLYNYVVAGKHLSNMPQALHEKLIQYVRKYFMIGGMPAVVNEYVETKDILRCQKIQYLLLDTYRDDFGKYARQSKFAYLKKVFTQIPNMIGQKFIYAHVDKSLKSRDLKEALELLETAGIAYKVKKTSGMGIPLATGSNDAFFKILFLDVGLMHAASGIYGETVRSKDLTAIFKGAVAEQFVGQELIANANPNRKKELYYWAREARNSNAEVDYLIEKNNKIIPIEVKSGAPGRMKSMKIFLQQYNSPYGVKISQEKAAQTDKIITVPFYSVEYFIKKQKTKV